MNNGVLIFMTSLSLILGSQISAADWLAIPQKRGVSTAATLGIALDRYYRRTERWAGLGTGRLTVGCTLPAWGHQQVELEALAGDGVQGLRRPLVQ